MFSGRKIEAALIINGECLIKGKNMAKKKACKTKALKKGLWTASEVKILKKMFNANPTAAIAKKLSRSLDTVKKKASRMGLRKTKKYLKSIGRA